MRSRPAAFCSRLTPPHDGSDIVAVPQHGREWRRAGRRVFLSGRGRTVLGSDASAHSASHAHTNPCADASAQCADIRLWLVLDVFSGVCVARSAPSAASPQLGTTRPGPARTRTFSTIPAPCQRTCKCSSKRSAARTKVRYVCFGPWPHASTLGQGTYFPAWGLPWATTTARRTVAWSSRIRTRASDCGHRTWTP
jgi:hypothetical protein